MLRGARIADDSCDARIYAHFTRDAKTTEEESERKENQEDRCTPATDWNVTEAKISDKIGLSHRETWEELSRKSFMERFYDAPSEKVGFNYIREEQSTMGRFHKGELIKSVD